MSTVDCSLTITTPPRSSVIVSAPPDFVSDYTFPVAIVSSSLVLVATVPASLVSFATALAFTVTVSVVLVSNPLVACVPLATVRVMAVSADMFCCDIAPFAALAGVHDVDRVDGSVDSVALSSVIGSDISTVTGPNAFSSVHRSENVIKPF